MQKRLGRSGALMASRRNGTTMGKTRASQEYKAIMKELSQEKEELTDLNRAITKELNINVPFYRKITALCSKIPFIGKRLADYGDPLTCIESELRDFIYKVQNSLIALQEMGQLTLDETNHLKEDLKKAQEENWDLNQLRNYFAERSGIDIFPQVADLMELQQDKLMPVELQEKKKNELVENLTATVGLSQQLMNLIAQVIVNSLEIFENSVVQYDSFVHFAGPIKTIKETAQALTDTTSAAYTAREALMITLKKSMEAIEAASRAASLANEYHIRHGEAMTELIERGKRVLADISGIEAQTLYDESPELEYEEKKAEK
ncbi:MAG: hypothetical protein AB1643_02580 [Patescibacteria group bacterium]